MAWWFGCRLVKGRLAAGFWAEGMVPTFAAAAAMHVRTRPATAIRVSSAIKLLVNPLGQHGAYGGEPALRDALRPARREAWLT